ncbi:hypothetical protein BJ875DRAFT_375332 [Amylocarpus encephaloides]|uniref:C3H1-type domain-containing protein n=1 Tax=Amylocarpus encephaloides TaxID=45428 RepID=A0A9P7YJY3_9HELO|nr:hypothetical protein BJ875DRAFT_375332 [Amylocarpus encephaloides]
MLFPEQDAPFLKVWLVKRLGQTQVSRTAISSTSFLTSDADADVLADYVLALLRHDGDVETVRGLCMVEIPDFLKEDSATFIRDVFDAINYKSYLPSAGPLSSRSSAPFAPPTGPSSMPNYALPGPGAPPFGGSRKRTYNDRGDGDAQDRGGMMQMGDANGRTYKQPRRGGVGGRGGHDNFGHGRGGGGGYNPSFPPPGQGPPPQLPPLDPNDPMAFMVAMQTMGIPIPPPPGPPMPHAQPRRGRCRDYDQKGFCARGNTCMFEHGENSIFVPPGNRADEYDPADAGIVRGVERNGEPAARGGFGGNVNNGVRGGSDRGRGHGAFRGGQAHGNANRRGGRSEFSSDRPNHDRTKTTIVVENIPEDKFTEATVQEFFGQFGNIVDISMRPYKRLSIVKYEDWNGAQAAYSSPKVIFDNRFVKVYWFTSQENLPQPPPQATSANGIPIKNGATNTPQPFTPAPTRESDEPLLDPEEFARKQEEAQKLHEEKAKKKLKMEAARKELEKRSEELAKSRAVEKRKLMERLAAKTAKSGSESGTPAPTTETKNVSQTDALKAQLAALETEAQSLGIDTSLTDDTSSSHGYRGRGRGRDTYRGGRPYNPRGGFTRGGYRGRGGAPFAGVKKLDNRPKKVALTGVDFSASSKEESLRQYLLGIGEYASLDITPSSTSITFKERFVGEKFMYSLTDGEIPGAGKVEMSWVQTPLPPVNLPPPGGPKRDEQDEGDDVMAMDDSPVRTKNEREPVGGDNLDYDAADDGGYAP